MKLKSEISSGGHNSPTLDTVLDQVNIVHIFIPISL